jgi:hypothetical protein
LKPRDVTPASGQPALVAAHRAVRVAVARELLDRACGRLGQALTGETGTGPVSFTLVENLYPNG